MSTMGRTTMMTLTFKKKYSKTIICIAFIILILLLISACSKLSATFGTINNNQQIVDRSNSVLYLEVYDMDGDLIKTASGFVIEDGSTLVTNYHVVEDAYRIIASTADGERSVETSNILAYDELADLAILCCDVNPGVDALPLGDLGGIQQGTEVYAIGYPLGLANTLSNGIISSRYIDENGIDILQITAAISNGSSGGALLNSDGEVIGVTTASYSAGQNLNIAVSVSEVKKLLLEAETTPILLTTFYELTNPYARLEAFLIAHGEQLDFSGIETAYYASNTDDTNFSFEIVYVEQSSIREPGISIRFDDIRNQILDFEKGSLSGTWNYCEIYIIPEKRICTVEVHMCKAELIDVYGNASYAAAKSDFVPFSDVNSNMTMSYTSVGAMVSDADIKETSEAMLEITLASFAEWLSNHDIGCQISDFI